MSFAQYMYERKKPKQFSMHLTLKGGHCLVYTYTMKEKFIMLLIPVLAMILLWPSSSMAERDLDPCRLFPNGTRMRDPDDCSQEITCVDFKSVYGTLKCSGTTPFYDKDTNKCVKALTDHSLCDINCTNATGTFLEDPKSCYGYFYCQDEELALYGHCPDTTHFNETRQACIYSDESDCNIKTINFCAIVKDGINFKDESSCDAYFVCKKGVLTSTVCKSTYYDAATGTCIQKSLVDCPVHPYPSNVCGTKTKPLKGAVSDGATCRGYFYCATLAEGFDANPIWLQCPENKFFNSKTALCDDPLNVVCTEDRCEGRNLTFVSSSEAGCRHYSVCSNGVAIMHSNCGNKFFDEEQGICTSTIITYPSCAA